jgi:hypothetical protein
MRPLHQTHALNDVQGHVMHGVQEEGVFEKG